MSKFETEKPSVRPFSQRISIEINLCEKKVMPFWSFIFPETYIYIIDHVYKFIATRGKCAQQLSYGFNILEVLESCPLENQIPYGDMDFSKKVPKVTDFRW